MRKVPPALLVAIKHNQRDVVRRLLALSPSQRVLQQALELVVKSSPDTPPRAFLRQILRAGADVSDALLLQSVKRKDPAARLLAKHVDTNELMHSMIREDNPRMLSWLLTEGGAKVNYRCEGGATALIKASQMGRLAVVKQLLQMQPAPRLNLQSSNGSTALHRAAAMGHFGIVKLLIDKRAKHSLVNAEGQTALELAQQNGFKKIERILIGLRNPKSAPKTK